MNKKLLKEIIHASYSGKDFDPKKVNAIADMLSRSELKEYINALKQEQQKKTVYIEMPILTDNPFKKELEKLFPDKVISYDENKDLLLGLKITDNDIIYELNIKNRLERLKTFLEEQYD